MTIGTITYQTLVDVIKTAIKSNCINIYNYAGIPASYKAGYTNKVLYAGSGTASLSYYTCTIKSNDIKSVTSSTVDTDMTAFLSSCGLTNLAQNIPASEFLDFIKDMVVFCSTKLVMVGSQLSTAKYLCYDTSNTTYNNKFALDTNQAYKIMEATDITTLLSNIITLTRQTIRNKTCQYTYTMSAS